MVSHATFRDSSALSIAGKASSLPIISADGMIAAARQLCTDAPVVCDILAERRTSSP
jgi:hypothetical protein